jgi:nucleotide-binding universal stress UspA family protein
MAMPVHSPRTVPFPHLSGESRIRSIAVASDPPGNPTNALSFAIRIAERLRSRLLLEPARAGGTGPRYIVVHPKPAETSEPQGRVRVPRRRGVVAGEIHRSRTNPALAASTAHDPKPDLLVLGSRAVRGPGGYVLGSNAHRALEAAEVPCLVSRETIALPLRRVLLPIDFSDLEYGMVSLAAAWLAGYLRTESDAGNPGRSLELHVLHVARDMDEERLMDIELTEEIRRALEEAGPKPSVAIRKLVHSGGDPTGEILRVAERHNADLVLMRAFDGRSWIRRLTGSVSSAVLRQAECPLVLLPPRLWMPSSGPDSPGAA